MIKIKQCSGCGASFECGDTSEGAKCWCNNYPPIFQPSDVLNCLCPNCFKTACSSKIEDYVATITPDNIKDNRAKDLPKSDTLIEGIDYYLENGNYVFKSWYHLKRGYCCENGCRHCPYKD